MLYILKGDFPTKKLFGFLSTFFCRSKEAHREWHIETSRIRPFLAAWKALWGDDVIGLFALAAWTQFWCFC